MYDVISKSGSKHNSTASWMRLMLLSRSVGENISSINGKVMY